MPIVRVDRLEFEIERRSVIFHRDTTMEDESTLGFIGNPNNAVLGATTGQSLLYWSPAGSFYLDKGANPQTFWVKVEDGAGGLWVRADGESGGGGGGLEDAPIDGRTFGRKEGSWVEIASGESGELPYIPIIAAENLGGHRVVTVDGYYASNINLNTMYKIAGITRDSGNINTEVRAYNTGYMTYESWNWELGKPIYLKENGFLTQTIPTSGYQIVLGYPRSNTSIIIEIQSPLKLEM